MENEIKVGEYCRTDSGIDNLLCKTKYDNGANKYVFEKQAMSNPEYYVIKHSNNLKDLIEIGDLVKIEDNCGIVHWFEVYENSGIYQYEILEVVTKEMMASISYKVERS